MGSIFIIQGILIYIYAFDHRSTLVACLSKNDFIDEHEAGADIAPERLYEMGHAA